MKLVWGCLLALTFKKKIVLQVIYYEYHHCQNKNQSMGLKKLINFRFERVKF